MLGHPAEAILQGSPNSLYIKNSLFLVLYKVVGNSTSGMGSVEEAKTAR